MTGWIERLKKFEMAFSFNSKLIPSFWWWILSHYSFQQLISALSLSPNSLYLSEWCNRSSKLGKREVQALMERMRTHLDSFPERKHNHCQPHNGNATTIGPSSLKPQSCFQGGRKGSINLCLDTTLPLSQRVFVPPSLLPVRNPNS